jgi:nucleotide-binding universal stress UspA family protein
MRGSIIASVVDSHETTEAAEVAAALARDLGRRLVLAHVADDPPVFPYGDRWLREAQRRRAMQRSNELLDAVAYEVGEPTARRRIALSGVVHGDPQDRLEALIREEHAELVVVGSRLGGVLTRVLLGSGVDSLASSSQCPVVVVPPGSGSVFADRRGAPFGSIVCGVDGSPASERARVVAETLADRLGARLLSVYVETGDSRRDRPDGVSVVSGDPEATLAEFAMRHGSQLIVVGSHGRGVQLGPVSGLLAALAPIPVVVVPPTARLPHFAASQTAEAARAA